MKKLFLLISLSTLSFLYILLPSNIIANDEIIASKIISGDINIGNLNANTSSEFTVNFNTDIFSDNTIEVVEVKLMYYVNNIVNGNLEIVDKYNSNIIESRQLNIVGIDISDKYLNVFNNWRNNINNNKGLIFKAVNFTNDESVNISSISLSVKYIIEDKIPPQIISQRVIKGNSYDSYTIELETSEPTIVELDYGKTSEYGLKNSINTYNTNHSFILYFLDVGYTYHYRLTIKDQSNNILQTNNATFITGVDLLLNQDLTVTNNSLLPPTKLIAEIATVNNKKGVLLSFEKSQSPNVSLYIIFKKKVNDNSFKEIAQIESNILNYTDYDLKPGENYYYAIKSFYNNGISAFSESVLVYIPLDVNNSSINWNDSRSNVLLALFTSASIVLICLVIIIRTVKVIFLKLFPPIKKKGLENTLRYPID